MPLGQLTHAFGGRENLAIAIEDAAPQNSTFLFYEPGIARLLEHAVRGDNLPVAETQGDDQEAE